MDFDNINKLFLKTISDKMMSYFNMFSFSVLHRIFNNAYGTTIVYIYNGVHEIVPIIQKLILKL